MNKIRLAIVLPIIGLLHACITVGPDYKKPEMAAPEQWSEVKDGSVQTGSPSRDSLATWWQSLGDSTLNALIEQGMRANLAIRTAEAQLRQARAQRAVVGSRRFPSIDANAAANHARSSENAGTGITAELYSSSLDAGWEMDIFGGRQRAIEAAEADYQAAQEARYEVLVSVVAEIALSYIELRTLQAQLSVATQNLHYREETLKIVQTQYAAGAVLKLDLDRATSHTETTRADIPRLRQNITQSTNRLAVLLAKNPGALNGLLQKPAPLPTPALNVVVGVPADALRQRPDVRRAERQLAAETARVGVATAALYPQFNLTGSIGIDALSTAHFFAGESHTFGIGPLMQWNIFAASRIRQQIEVQNAVQEQALIQYQASILGALEEVENAMTAFLQEQQRHLAFSHAAAAAKSAAEIAQSRYEAGASDFLTVLDAQRSLLSAQNNRVSSAGSILSNLIRLYQSLGGGWTPTGP